MASEERAVEMPKWGGGGARWCTVVQGGARSSYTVSLSYKHTTQILRSSYIILISV